MSTVLAVYAVVLVTRSVQVFLLPSEDTDPITAFLTRDWASLGGWSLFIGLAMLIVVGAFREWWVPGPRYRRQEDALTKSLDLNKTQTDQITDLIEANEISKHFFENVPVRLARRTRKSTDHTGADAGGDPE